MRGYATIASVGLLTMGLLAIPNLSPAADGSTNRDENGRHSLLNADLRSKIEHVANKFEEPREPQHNQGGIHAAIQSLQTDVANLKATVAGLVSSQAALLSQLNAANAAANARLTVLETGGGSGGSTNPFLTNLAKYVTVDLTNTINGVKPPHVIIHDANVHVLSGSGTTDDKIGATGLGNLIVGYNEMPTSGLPTRSGSHNLIVGPSHSYSSFGGVVFGDNNFVSGKYATTLGGNQNLSSGPESSILGGFAVTVTDTQATYP
jgi:hypothetical protein